MVHIELLHMLLFQRISNDSLYRVLLITIQTPSTVEGCWVEFLKRNALNHIKNLCPISLRSVFVSWLPKLRRQSAHFTSLSAAMVLVFSSSQLLITKSFGSDGNVHLWEGQAHHFTRATSKTL